MASSPRIPSRFWKCFYQELYQSINRTSNNSEKISSFLDNLTIPKLSETAKNSCEGKISAGECYKLLDSFQNNKTPGNDGIPIEFYKKILVFNQRPFYLFRKWVFRKRRNVCVTKASCYYSYREKRKRSLLSRKLAAHFTSKRWYENYDQSTRCKNKGSTSKYLLSITIKLDVLRIVLLGKP